MSTASRSSSIIPSAALCARSSAIFILKPWLPLVAFARLQQEHSSCKLRTSSLPSSLGIKKPMVERRNPIVTEWALGDALQRLVNMIEELRVDVDLPVEITTDDTQLLKLSFSGTPDVGFPLQREVRDLPGQVVRHIWNEGLRDYDTRTAPATRSETIGSGHAGAAHSKPAHQGVTPNDGGRSAGICPREPSRRHPQTAGRPRQSTWRNWPAGAACGWPCPLSNGGAVGAVRFSVG